MSYTADSIRDSIRIRIVTPDSIRIRFERKRPIRRSLCIAMMGVCVRAQESSSVPGSPSMVRRNSRTRRFSWRQDLALVGRSAAAASAVAAADCRPRRADEPPPPLVTPCLDNLDLPYADDDPAPSSTADADDNLTAAALARLVEHGC